MHHAERRAERPDHPHRSRHARRHLDAALLAAGRAGRRACRQSADQAGAAPRREPRAVPGRQRPLRPDRARLPASRHRSRLRAARRRRPALRLPRLAVRRRPASAWRRRPSREGSRMCANIRQKAYPVVEKSGILFAYMGPGEPPEFPHFDCFVAPASAHLRVQGHDRLQLAAIARGRHRSGAHLVPASLLPRRGPDARLRQAVPRHLDRFRHADDADHARASRARRSRSSRPTTACASSRCGGSATPTPTCASPISCSRTPS